MLKTKRKSVSQTKRKSGSQDNGEVAPSLNLKERLAQKRKADRLRKELINFTIFSFFFSAVVGFIVGVAIAPKVGVGAAIGILYTSLSFKYPRQAMYAFLIYMPLGGTITYTLGNSPLLQLAKDGFYIPALFGVIQYCRRERLPIFVSRPLVGPLITLLVFCLLTLIFVNGSQQFASPDLLSHGSLLNDHSLIASSQPYGYPTLSTQSGPRVEDQPMAMGILGLKVLVGYIPLIVCSYYLLRNREDLLSLMRLTVVLILICCALGFIQYLFLKTGRCAGTQGTGNALFRASLESRCFVGGSLLYSPEQGQIRLPGTFVAPWQWGWFLISGSFLAFASAFNDPKAHWRTLSLVALASVFVMSVVSGQRIALALVPTGFILLLILTGQIVQFKRFLPTAIALALLLGGVTFSNPQVLQDRVASFQGRWDASPPHVFILNQFRWAIGGQEGFLGKGLGRATNSARVFGETALIETYYPKVLYEIGPFGTLAFLVLVTTLVYVTFRAYRSIRDRNLRNFGASFWVFVLFISYNTYYYPLDVDPVAVYYWFFAGVILRLPDIERQERLDALEAERPASKRKRRLKRAGFA
jgi:hypothetical protein